jgi:hypothetical protein
MKKVFSAMQMSIPVSDQEKVQAKKLIVAFKNSVKTLKICTDHLKIIHDPFEANPTIPSTEIVDYRAALRRFRDKSVDNFNYFKYTAFQCVSLSEMFASDTQTSKFVKSFTSSIDDLEKNVNSYVDLFEDLKADTFVSSIIKKTDNIFKEAKLLEESIDDRIIPYIQTNILGTSWIDTISDDVKKKLDSDKPTQIDIFEEGYSNN